MIQSTRAPLSTTRIGLDVGDKKTHFFCVLDSERSVVARGSFETTSKALQKSLAPYPGARVVLEAGSQSPCMSRDLHSQGFAVHVVDARRVQLISQDPRKSDRRDAEMLARLEAGLPEVLGRVHHRGERAQGHLCIVRSRDLVVRMRRMLIQQVRGYCKAFGVRLPKASTPAFSKKVEKLIPEPLVDAVAPLLKQVTALSKMIDDYEATLEKIAESEYPETKVLRQVNGVGPLISVAFILTLDNPHRFTDSRRVGAWLGLCSRSHASGDSAPQLRISKAGDKFMRRLLVQGAQYILGRYGKDSDLRRHGLKLIANSTKKNKKSKKRAAVAVARKLAVLLHQLWRTGAKYDPLYTSNRNTTTASA